MNSLTCAGAPEPDIPLRTNRNGTDERLGAMRVAIVADDPSEAALLGDWLTLAGHRCRHFSHGGALIRAFDQLALDAVVLDWTLLDVSAADVLRRIRGSDRASLPVLFVGGHRREHDVVRALRQGADDYVVQPVGGARARSRGWRRSSDAGDIALKHPRWLSSRPIESTARTGWCCAMDVRLK